MESPSLRAILIPVYSSCLTKAREFAHKQEVRGRLRALMKTRIMPANNSLLAQGLDGIKAHGAARGDPACQ
jgi:hypothetical protein